MNNGDLSFGLVIAPTPPRNLPEEVQSDPHKALRATMEANERAIEAMRPQ